jgi:hypothetical protein
MEINGNGKRKGKLVGIKAELETCDKTEIGKGGICSWLKRCRCG